MQPDVERSTVRFVNSQRLFDRRDRVRHRRSLIDQQRPNPRQQIRACEFVFGVHEVPARLELSIEVGTRFKQEHVCPTLVQRLQALRTERALQCLARHVLSKRVLMARTLEHAVPHELIQGAEDFLG